MAGTWQALIRSSFRLSSTLPSTANFAPAGNNGFHVVRVSEQRYEEYFQEGFILSASPLVYLLISLLIAARLCDVPFLSVSRFLLKILLLPLLYLHDILLPWLSTWAV